MSIEADYEHGGQRQTGYDAVGAEAEYGRAVAGYTVGVLHIRSTYALAPGNMQHVGSFPFPVLFEEVVVDSLDDLFSGAPYIEDRLISAAQQAVANGARALVGACGSFGYHQKAVAEKTPVPVFLSILTQVSFIQQALGGDRLGVICATKSSMTPRIYEACDVRAPERLVIAEMSGRREFDRFIAAESPIDFAALERETIAATDELLEQGAIGGILLQCSDLPPFARALQRHAGLPVFDAGLLLRWAHDAVRYPSFAF